MPARATSRRRCMRSTRRPPWPAASCRGRRRASATPGAQRWHPRRSPSDRRRPEHEHAGRFGNTAERLSPTTPARGRSLEGAQWRACAVWSTSGCRALAAHRGASRRAARLPRLEVALFVVRELDPQLAVAEAERERERTPLRRQPRRDGQRAVEVAYAAEAEDERLPGAGGGGDVDAVRGVAGGVCQIHQQL